MLKRKFLPSEASKAFRAKLNSRQIFNSLRGIANSLRSERGESIMEIIISILIFSILLTTALAIVRTSLVITGNAIVDAASSQHALNELFLSEDLPNSGRVITFSDGTGGFINSSHEIDYAYDARGILAFRPPIDNSGGEP